MPNRIIHEKTVRSAALDALSDFAERLFHRLTTQADDGGRFPADPDALLVACFPLRIGRVKLSRVRHARDELVAAGLVRLYEVAGRPYGEIVTWRQRKRARTKYPDPGGHPPANGGHPRADGGHMTAIWPPDDGQMTAMPPSRARVLDSDLEAKNLDLVLELKQETTREGGAGGNLFSPKPVRASAPNGAGSTPAPFALWAHIAPALAQCPRLGRDRALHNPEWWRAQSRAFLEVDLVGELLKAEAWCVANPAKAPKRRMPRFLHSWFSRKQTDEEQED